MRDSVGVQSAPSDFRPLCSRCHRNRELVTFNLGVVRAIINNVACLEGKFEMADRGRYLFRVTPILKQANYSVRADCRIASHLLLAWKPRA